MRNLLVYTTAVVLLSIAAGASDTSHTVSDEALRLVALRSIFPGMDVSIERGTRLNDSWPEKAKRGAIFFPDALADESVYKVVGEAMNQAEREASGNIVTGKFSTTRQLRFRLFQWPNENDAGLLAVLQYAFPDARPAMSCPSIGLLVHLVKDNATWAVKEQYLLETVHHHSIQGIRLLDIIGRGTGTLVVESNSGGAGTVESSLQVFDLSRARFDEILYTDSRLQSMTDDWYTQVLDGARTRARRGQQLCFSKTTLFENGRAFRPPRITYPCYEHGEGVDSVDASRRNKMLLPSR